MENARRVGREGKVEDSVGHCDPTDIIIHIESTTCSANIWNLIPRLAVCALDRDTLLIPDSRAMI